MNPSAEHNIPATLTPSERVQAFVKGTTPGAVKETPNHRLNADLQNTSIFFSASIAIGMALVITHAISDPADHSTGNYVHQTTVSLWALACLACGAAVGFLFGIPKVRQRGWTPAPSGGDMMTPGAANYSQLVNTNLEDISDWITKIIVGLGLINIQHIGGFLDRLAQRLTVDQSADQQAFALSLIIYFLVIGFLFGYLITRMFLQRAFWVADQQISGDSVQASALETVRKAAAAEQSAAKTLQASKDT